jgi:hypothetical protein
MLAGGRRLRFRTLQRRFLRGWVSDAIRSGSGKTLAALENLLSI